MSIIISLQQGSELPTVFGIAGFRLVRHLRLENGEYVSLLCSTIETDQVPSMVNQPVNLSVLKCRRLLKLRNGLSIEVINTRC